MKKKKEEALKKVLENYEIEATNERVKVLSFLLKRGEINKNRAIEALEPITNLTSGQVRGIFTTFNNKGLIQETKELGEVTIVLKFDVYKEFYGKEALEEWNEVVAKNVEKSKVFLKEAERVAKEVAETVSEEGKKLKKEGKKAAKAVGNWLLKISKDD